VYPFKVSEVTMNNWTHQLSMVIEEANYHYTSRDFTLPYKFMQTEVVL